MYSSILLSLAAIAAAAPAAVQKRDAAPSPTLFTFTYLGNPVTATWYGTSTVDNPPCPTQTFTYEGVGITIPYTGPGTPESCLTPAGSPATANPPCPTQTFTYEGVGITIPYTGPGTPESCLTPPGGSLVTAQPPPAETTEASSAPVETANPPPVTTQPPASSSAVFTIQTSVPASLTSAPPQSSAAPSAVSLPKGFNYGAQGQTLESFQNNFQVAQNLAGTSGFNSARLFTMIQEGTTNDPTGAIQAAINTNTTLLLGLFYPNVDNELAALSRAIQQYGSAFADLVVAISVGSEDLYRNSPTGIAAKSNPGANPQDIVNFIGATRNVIAGTSLAGKLVGHVDTWTAYVNASNTAVIDACDFLGMDAYPYYQNTEPNDVSSGRTLLEAAYDATVAVAQGKPVWITESGWPVSGPTENLAVAGVSQAETYWKDAGCGYAFESIPTYWYLLVDAGATPSFGVTSGGTTPLYDLSCPA